MDDQNVQNTPRGDEAGAAASEPENTLNAETMTNGQTAAGDADAVAANREGEIPLDVRVEQAEARANDYLDSLQRERASFQNYKRRVERERLDQSKAIAGNLLLKLLPVLDDFYRATDAIPQAERDQWYDGVLLIQRKLERFLNDEGVSEIDALGQPFDPAFHEAVGVDSTSSAPSGTITDVVQRGYRQGDRVLRPALVRVAP